MAFIIVWTDRAIDDLTSIGAWIARTSVDDALDVMDRLEERARSLIDTPERGRPVPEVAALGPWRELIVDPWRIVYRIDGSTVWILAVLDGRRSLRDLLFERLIRPR